MRHESYGRRMTNVAVCVASLRIAQLLQSLDHFVLFAGDLPNFISKVSCSFQRVRSTSSCKCVQPEIKRRSEYSTYFVNFTPFQLRTRQR
jgi:hypothetical protein